MNKVKLFILLLLIALATNVSAQFGIGLKGGLDFNSVTRSNSGRIDETYHAKKGLGYGLILSYQINDWFAMRADIEMLSRSHTMKRNLNYVKDIYTDYNNKYLTVPVKYDSTTGSGTYEFSGLPDNDHEYRIKVISANYETKYQNEPSGEYAENNYKALFNSAITATVNAYLHFVPTSFDLKYQ